HTIKPHSLTSFLLKLRATHRHLPSFPTRRSSDLDSRNRRRVEAGEEEREQRQCDDLREREERERRDRLREPDRAAVGRSEHEPRSEEHTSELQSPDHLVCRLLLEKKKIKEIRT